MTQPQSPKPFSAESLRMWTEFLSDLPAEELELHARQGSPAAREAASRVLAARQKTRSDEEEES